MQVVQSGKEQHDPEGVFKMDKSRLPLLGEKIKLTRKQLKGSGLASNTFWDGHTLWTGTMTGGKFRGLKLGINREQFKIIFERNGTPSDIGALRKLNKK